MPYLTEPFSTIGVQMRSWGKIRGKTMTDNDTATLSRPAKIFFPKREEEHPPAKEQAVLDMGEGSRLEGFRQNGCR